MSPNSIQKLGFRVNPSNAEFNYDTGSDEIAIALDLIKSTRDVADSYITTPENYKIQKIEPAVNDEGKIKMGQYIAYIQDLGSLDTFRDKVALVLTTKDRSGTPVQYSSEVFEVTTGELPILYLTTPGAQKITSKENWMADCSIEIVTPNGDNDIYLSNVSLRGRGNSTWGYPKKPYAIKLDKKSEVLGMPTHKRWVLLANWMDKTLMRNSVAFEIARKTGLEWTPRGTFVEVVLNGTHQGNYYLCEQIKVDKNRVNVAELKEKDTEEPAITGGYLVELDTYYDEVNKFRSIHRNLPVNFKEPDEDVLNTQQMNWFKDYFNRIENILYGSGEGSYRDYIDVSSFIDWWLVYELTINWEPNHPKSSYMHKDRNGKLKAGPVWDFDFATFKPTNNVGFKIKNAIWYGNLFKDPAFVEEVKQRWNTLKPGFQSIIPFIDEQAAYIRQSAIVNTNMWPINQNTNGDEKMSFDDAVSRLRDAYEARMNTLDGLIGDL
ncbi:MAG: CotH kinase family protein [Peptostreptococcales bacterium]